MGALAILPLLERLDYREGGPLTVRLQGLEVEGLRFVSGTVSIRADEAPKRAPTAPEARVPEAPAAWNGPRATVWPASLRESHPIAPVSAAR